jgi:hypothetical protein
MVVHSGAAKLCDICDMCDDLKINFKKRKKFIMTKDDSFENLFLIILREVIENLALVIMN